MKDKKDYLIKSVKEKKNRERISILEKLIPQTEKLLNNLPENNITKEFNKVKFSEYLLEYQERTGHSYESKREQGEIYDKK